MAETKFEELTRGGFPWGWYSKERRHGWVGLSSGPALVGWGGDGRALGESPNPLCDLIPRRSAPVVTDEMDQAFLRASYDPANTRRDALAAILAIYESSNPRQPAPSIGWLYHNPDVGLEFALQHPVESGETPDAEDITEATAENLLRHLRDAWAAAEVDARALASATRPGPVIVTDEAADMFRTGGEPAMTAWEDLRDADRSHWRSRTAKVAKVLASAPALPERIESVSEAVVSVAFDAFFGTAEIGDDAVTIINTWLAEQRGAK